MITVRDRDIFRYLEEYKFITLDEAAILFLKVIKVIAAEDLKSLWRTKKFMPVTVIWTF